MSISRIVFFSNEESAKRQAISQLCAFNQHQELLANDHFQYGLVHFEKDQKLQLVDGGEPSLMNLILKNDDDVNLGVVVLIDEGITEFQKHLVIQLEHIKPYIADMGIAVGLIKRSTSKSSLEAVNKKVRDAGFKAPVFEVNPASREDMALLIQALLISIDHQLSTVH